MLLLLSAARLLANHQRLILVVVFRLARNIKVLRRGLHASDVGTGTGCVALGFVRLHLRILIFLIQLVTLLVEIPFVYLYDSWIILPFHSLLTDISLIPTIQLLFPWQVLLSQNLTTRANKVLIFGIGHPEPILDLNDVAFIYHVVHFFDQILFCSRIQIKNQRMVLPHGSGLLHLMVKSLLLHFHSFSLFVLFHLLNLYQLFLLLRLQLFQYLYDLLECVLWSHLNHSIIVRKWIAILINGRDGKAPVEDLDYVILKHLLIPVLRWLICWNFGIFVALHRLYLLAYLLITTLKVDLLF